MFDIAFSELLLIAVVALIVIGPERLPKVARTAGHLFGRMQRYVADVRADISREMELEELKRLQSSMEDAARSLGQSVERQIGEAESEFNRLAQAAQPQPDGASDPEPGEPQPPAGERSGQLDLALDAPRETPAGGPARPS